MSLGEGCGGAQRAAALTLFFVERDVRGIEPITVQSCLCTTTGSFDFGRDDGDGPEQVVAAAADDFVNEVLGRAGEDDAGEAVYGHERQAEGQTAAGGPDDVAGVTQECAELHRGAFLRGGGHRPRFYGNAVWPPSLDRNLLIPGLDCCVQKTRSRQES